MQQGYRTIRCVIVFGLALLCCIPQGVMGVGVSSAGEAIERARVFAVAVGWTIDKSPEAQFPGQRTRANTWHVQAGEIEVWVDSGTGQIHQADRTGIVRGERPTSTSLSAWRAESYARRYLACAGVDVTASRLYRCEFNAHVRCWDVIFQRMYRGLPFQRDLTLVTLDPNDGSLIGFGYNFLSPLPTFTSDRMHKDGAVRRSVDYASRRLNYPGGARSATLQIVQPNYLWEYHEAGAPIPAPTFSRVAWVVQLDAPYEVTEFWVDAETGEVIGGDHSLGRAKPGTRALSLDGTSLAKLKRSGKCKLVDSKDKAYGAIARAVESLAHKRQPAAKLPATLTFCGKERAYTFGYSPDDHCLALVQKNYKGRVIKGNLAWETTKEFEDLIAKYLPH